jgi:ABC-type Fe3+/spermidine/putrescine transport system ATPase subunit
MAIEVRVERLSRLYGGKSGVRDLSFTAPPGSFVTLLGPSGCGKTTTLRCLAGLTQPDRGDVWFGDRQVNGQGVFVPPEKRGIGMVFQSYALWPHLTVFDNIAYPLKARGDNKAQLKEKVPRVAARLGIEKYLDRYPAQLSGGQQQRVALARSLSYEPDLLLLDEPLSNLDARLREHMLEELSDLQQRLGVTTIYVTHSQEEAMVMSTEILLLNEGDLVQAAAPRDLYETPKTRFAANFMGDATYFEGTLRGGDGRRVVQGDVQGLDVTVASDGGEPGQAVTAMVRPHKFNVSRTDTQTPNSWPAKVTKSAFNAGVTTIDVEVFGLPVRVLGHDMHAPGEDVWLSVAPEDVVLLEREP